MEFKKDFKETKKFRDILNAIERGEIVRVCGGNIPFFAFLISCIFEEIKRKFFIILPDDLKAERFFQDIRTFLPDTHIYFLPAQESFSEDEISVETAERVKILTYLLKDFPSITVTHPSAIIQSLPSPSDFEKNELKIEAGGEIRRDEFLRKIINFGYEETEIVETPGEFAKRGCIVDIFPLDSESPVRVEFLGNRINSIRKFEVSSQISYQKIENIFLYPLSERLIYTESPSTIFDFINGATIFFIEPDSVNIPNLLRKDWNAEIIEKFKEISNICTERITSETLRKIFYFKVLPVSERFKIQPHFIWQMDKEDKVFIFSESTSQQMRLKEILNEKGICISQIKFHDGNLSSGFSIPELNIVFLSNDEIFQRYKTRRVPVKRIENIPLNSWEELKTGDYVVHYNEGIGKFIGMKRMKIDGKEEEFIIIEYAGGDKLYLPVSQISLIHKYIGSKKPVLSKLGSKNWIKIRENVKNSIRDLAADLYRLYVERKKEKGFSFLPDDELQREFENNFIYEETPDQKKAIEEVKRDMVSGKIMDRLLCGDSGYGKTEVAMRASFKAVLSGKQVAVLVPTTVLALQHYFTFKERFADFPVRIEMLSRFIPKSQQKRIIQQLQEGKIDIIIGTHRILQDDVKFKDLGLLIIDEEQRFGVVHKEKIKTVFRKVDVLTMTATPIPRTLYLSLSGIRDISIIETPPLGRLSVTTYVGPYNPEIVRQAIIREIDRNGQVFYLHNYIYDIKEVKAKIERLVPFAKVGIAHGRMEENALAEVMEKFSEGKIDVLVATTIVENGLDIPRANTLIVDNAHRFGLSDLYQLRGRVGRYKWKAYAYFLFPPHILLTKKAKERLKTIQQLNSPGSGFKIAMKDLEIRGAGNILGKEQHGFIEQVGFHLYCQFWKEIASEIKGEVPEIPEEVNFKGFIPEDYVLSPSLRFHLYKKIASIKSKNEAENMIYELKDRFGYVPEEVKNLIFSKVN
ncbi:MAG: transcription-repair coupling factor [Candidatus Omnitrophota bacterium]|nr:MAG: transcription-repair coupling factor [Candidatus Omnitrophota bacterium]